MIPLLKKMAIPALFVSLCSAPAANATDRYIVKYKQGWDGNNTLTTLMSSASRNIRNTNNRQHILNFGGHIKRLMGRRNAVAAELTAAQKNSLMTSGDVDYIEIDPRRAPFEPVSVTSSTTTPMTESVPYGISMVQADQLSDANTNSVTVCITDTGYDGDHEDLRFYQSAGISGNDNDNNGNDTGNWYEDNVGHGTHVAGTISAIGNNNIGVVGVNPGNQVGLHIVKVFTNDGNWKYGSDMIAAIDQCTDAGAKIISMSLGGSGSSITERNAFQEAYNNGILLVAAAGNDGTTSGGNDPYSYPASYDMVMSVAAIDSSKDVASFSQKNDQVEIAAPGVDVQSTLPDNKYAAWSGTSMATPHVSAVAALVWSHFPTCTNDQIRATLNATADDLGASGQDHQYGHGLILAKDAYNYLTQFGCTGDDGSSNNGELNNNDTLTDLQGSFKEELRYFVNVPAGATNLSIAISGGSGDADLYTRFGTEPTTSTYDCRPYKNGNNETCNTASPNEGTYYIMIRGYAAFSGLNLSVSYDEANSGGDDTGTGELNNGDTISSLSGASREELHYFVNVPASASNMSIAISGGSGDADLYTRFGTEPTTSTYDCRPYKNGNNETCNAASPKEGTYYIMIRGYSAFSDLDLAVNYNEDGGSGDTGGSSFSAENLSANRNQWLHYTVEIPAGMSNLDVATNGGSGDADLYIRYGSTPTTYTYDCRPHKLGNVEACHFTNPSQGIWHISLKAKIYSPFNGVSLSGSYQ